MNLQSLWSSAMAMNGSVAVWRCPRDEKAYFLADYSEFPAKGRIDLQNTESGFIVSPFMNPEGNETLFLKVDIFATTDENGNWDVEKGEPRRLGDSEKKDEKKEV